VAAVFSGAGGVFWVPAAVFSRGGDTVFGNFAGCVPPVTVAGVGVVAIVASLPKED